jgi:cytochrome c-type biogenesis protein
MTTLSFLVLFVVAFSWMVFPILLDGDRVLFETGQQVKGERSHSNVTLTQILTRPILFPGGIDVQVLYASEEYFEYADRSGTADLYRPDAHFVFIVNEDVHTGLLPYGVPEARLQIDGQSYEPVSSEGPPVIEHHRTSIIRFSRFDGDNRPLVGPDTRELRLVLEHPWDRYATENGQPVPVKSTYIWQLPLDIPPELKSRDVFTTAVLFSLSAGLLSAVLTPCLLQLVLIFFATLGGVAAKEVAGAAHISPDARRRVMWAAGCFVAAYVVLFVASGAIIGQVGKEAQIFFANYTRPVAVVAGIIVILFGVWVGVRARAPLVCKVPGAERMLKVAGRGTLGTVLVSLAFSLGCMSCFGSAIIGTLFVYVGVLGSASAGAAIMGMFAAGVAIPFLLAALFFSRMRSLFDLVARHSRAVGTISTAVIVTFGVLLVTDNFHTVSDLIYPYLGLE